MFNEGQQHRLGHFAQVAAEGAEQLAFRNHDGASKLSQRRSLARLLGAGRAVDAWRHEVLQTVEQALVEALCLVQTLCVETLVEAEYTTEHLLQSATTIVTGLGAAAQGFQ